MNNEYHKIQTIFKRDMENKGKTLLIGEWTFPEFEYLANNNWVFTEKVDGTNIRVMFDGNQITFGGKSEDAQIPALLVTRLNNIFQPQIETFVKQFPNGVCLYGEGYGAKIQKGGGNYRSNQDFVLFDVNIQDWWLRRENNEEIANLLNLDIVPILGTGTLYDMINYVKAGFNSTWGDFLAEGIVARPEVELKMRNGDRIITKLKNRDFLHSK